MIPRAFDEIGAADIIALATNGVVERRTLEYKRELPGQRDSDKKEFLADVCSFANAGGGDILFGIDEQRSPEGKKTGLPQQPFGLGTTSLEVEQQRLDQLVRAGIAPRIPGLQIKPVSGLANGSVLLIRIPQSFAAPHMVTFQSESRFFSRTSNGKQPLDVHEIRAAFLASETVPERVRAFRLERIGRVLADEAPLPLAPGAKMVLHSLPLSAFDGRHRTDVTALGKDAAFRLPVLGTTGFHYSRFNVDGYLTHRPLNVEGKRCRGYTQLFRSGAIESVESDLLGDQNGNRYLASVAFEKDILFAAREFITAQQRLECSAPFLLSVSFIGVKGAAMTASRFDRADDGRSFDRDVVLVPEVLVEEPVGDITSILRPLFDAVWQAAGWEKSMNYDSKGRWVESGNY